MNFCYLEKHLQKYNDALADNPKGIKYNPRGISKPCHKIHLAFINLKHVKWIAKYFTECPKVE